MQADLVSAFTFRYRALFDNGLIEHELDHVFIANSNRTPVINPDEAAGFRWMGFPEIEREVIARPDAFTAWFKESYLRVFAYIGQT